MMKWLTFLYILCLHGVSLQANSGFGLFLEENEELSKTEYLRANAHLKSLEQSLADGIKFGVARPVAIKIAHSLEQSSFDCSDNDRHFEIESLEPAVIKMSPYSFSTLSQYKGHKRVSPDCWGIKSFSQSLEKLLLSLPGADNLARDLTSREKSDINFCELKERKNKLRSFRFNPTMKSVCEEVLALKERRRKFEYYNHKINKLLYRTKMEFDSTSMTDEDLTKYDICKADYKPTKVLSSGKRLKMLGMAIVYMAPGYTTSVMGHMAERYIYCLNDKLVDVLFEFTQMTKGELQDVRNVYSDYLSNVSEDYIKSLDGRIYMKFKTNPVTNRMGAYGFYQLYTNRDIIEVWPKVTNDEIYKGLQDNLKLWKDQKENFKNGVQFPDYDLFKNNCTHPVREKLNRFTEDYDINNWQGLTPINIFGFLKKKSTEKIIMYPSQRLLRKFRMLEKGESLFWENTTFWSEASEGYDGRGHYSSMILYPETHGLLNKLILNPTYGAINLGAAIVQTAYGILTAPIRWLSKIPGFKFLAPKKKVDPIAAGFRGIGMSLTEVIGVRMRFPKPSEWTEEELNFIYDELPSRDPKIIDFLFKKLHED